jgi:hypothetical protein
LEPKAFDYILNTAKLIGVVGERSLCGTGGGDRFISLSENDIGPQQALPPFNVTFIFFQPVRKAVYHVADHFAAFFLAS